MSKRPRFGGPTGVQRTCAFCGHGIPEQKPVYLVGGPGGRIVGPFHSGCAWKVTEKLKTSPTESEKAEWSQLGLWPSIREETLPE